MTNLTDYPNDPVEPDPIYDPTPDVPLTEDPNKDREFKKHLDTDLRMTSLQFAGPFAQQGNPDIFLNAAEKIYNWLSVGTYKDLDLERDQWYTYTMPPQKLPDHYYPERMKLSPEVEKNVCNCEGRFNLGGWEQSVITGYWMHKGSKINCGKPSRYSSVFECDDCDEYFFAVRPPENSFLGVLCPQCE